MLKRLITAIARILTMMGGATPTQPAGPVSQEPTQPNGKASIASATKAPAKPKPKRKPSAAQSTKPAASRKPKQKPARPAAKASGVNGKQPATRASKTRQHAK